MEDIEAGLGKVSLTGKEKDELVIGEEAIDGEIEECKHSVFVKVLSKREVHKNSLKQMLRRVWGAPREARCIEVGEGIIQVLVGSDFSLWKIMEGAPWNFDQNLILLKKWERGLSASSLKFDRVPIWVQLWGLPFEGHSKKVVELIGKRIGEFLEVDPRTEEGERGTYLRVRVNILVDKPLQRGGTMKLGRGKAKWIEYRYEKLLKFCFICGVLGHEGKSCPTKFSNQINGVGMLVKEQYGPGLRVFHAQNRDQKEGNGVAPRRYGEMSVRRGREEMEVVEKGSGTVGGKPRARVSVDTQKVTEAGVVVPKILDSVLVDKCDTERTTSLKSPALIVSGTSSIAKEVIEKEVANRREGLIFKSV